MCTASYKVVMMQYNAMLESKSSAMLRFGRDARCGRHPGYEPHPDHSARNTYPNLKKKSATAPESYEKDSCALKAFEVVCAMRAGRISAGAHISYR